MNTRTSAMEQRYDKLGPVVVKALQKHHFDAYYYPTHEEALTQITALIPETDIVSWGGSETLTQIGLLDLIKTRNKVIDRDTATTPAERTELMRQALLCDTFLMSSNAISEDGQLYNIDGTGNRLAAMTFGPKSVIVVAGMNKVAKTIGDAESRTRNLASPANAQKFPVETPCKATGACADCLSKDCICTYLLRTRISRPAGRIKVILIGEHLGL